VSRLLLNTKYVFHNRAVDILDLNFIYSWASREYIAKSHLLNLWFFFYIKIFTSYFFNKSLKKKKFIYTPISQILKLVYGWGQWAWRLMGGQLGSAYYNMNIKYSAAFNVFLPSSYIRNKSINRWRNQIFA